MPQWLVFAILGAIFVILVMVQFVLHAKKPVKKAIFSMFIGILTLVIVNLSAPFTGIEIPISLLSLCVSSIAGIPGVATLVLLSTVL